MKKEKRRDDYLLPKNVNYFNIILIIVVGIIAYSNTLHSPFAFDDHRMIVTNNKIKNNSIFLEFNNPRYIGTITFALNYRINELDPFGYHLVNIIIHLFNAILVYMVMLNIISLVKKEPLNKNEFILPFIIALIFLLHPVQTQAITYISQRFASLAAFFVMASLLSYLKFRKRDQGSPWHLILSLIFALLAFKTKENTIVLPVIIILMELIIYKSSVFSLKKRIICIFPFFALLIIVISSFINLNQPIENLFTNTIEKSKETYVIPRGQYLITEFRVIITYLRLLVLPVHQSIEYIYPLSQSFFELKTLLSFSLIVLLIAIAILISTKSPLISFGILWFFVFHIVESSVIPISDIIFEHRIYLPSIGIIMAFVYFINTIFIKYKLRGLKIFFYLIIAILGIATYARNDVWKDRISLWKDCVDKFPQNSRCHLNLGAAYITQEMYDPAIKELQTGLQGNTRDVEHRRLLALSYLKKGSIDLAVPIINQAVAIDPEFIQFYYQASGDFLEHHNYDAALTLLNSAHTIKETDWFIITMLGRTHCMLGHLNQALSYYDEALATGKNNGLAFRDKAFCLLSASRTAESRENFSQALAANQELVDCYFYIAITFENESNTTSAMQYYTLFLSKAPENNPLVPQAKAKLEIEIEKK